MQLAPGAAELKKAVAPAVIQALLRAGIRPGRIHVQDNRLVAVLRQICEAIGTQVRCVPLHTPPHARKELTKAMSGQMPH